MKFFHVVALSVTAFTLHASSDYPVQPVPFTNVRITGGLLHAR